MTAELPIDVLRHEHRVIQRVLTALETKAGEPACPREFLEHALDFFSNFAGRCHLAKEEERLFPLLWERGVPLEKGPLGPLMNDHEAARLHLAAMQLRLASCDGAPDALDTIRAEAGQYVALMREHMQKEEQRLFNVARSLLGPQDVKRLQRDFEEVELGPMGPAFHDWYEALAERLCAEPVKKEL